MKKIRGEVLKSYLMKAIKHLIATDTFIYLDDYDLVPTKIIFTESADGFVKYTDQSDVAEVISEAEIVYRAMTKLEDLLLNTELYETELTYAVVSYEEKEKNKFVEFNSYVDAYQKISTILNQINLYKNGYDRILDFNTFKDLKVNKYVHNMKFNDYLLIISLAEIEIIIDRFLKEFGASRDKYVSWHGFYLFVQSIHDRAVKNSEDKKL